MASLAIRWLSDITVKVNCDRYALRRRSQVICVQSSSAFHVDRGSLENGLSVGPARERCLEAVGRHSPLATTAVRQASRLRTD